ncbi:MAG TPA: hypothetical protein VIH56_04425 [Candidatus Acidoferrales bacterium]
MFPNIQGESGCRVLISKIGCLKRDHLNDVCGWSVDPFAGLVYAGICANGFYETFGTGDDALRLFDDEFEGGSKGKVSLLEQFKSAGMAVNRGNAALGLELAVDVFDVAPLKKRLFESFAVGMMANRAAALMAGQVNLRWSLWPFGRRCHVSLMASTFSDSLSFGRMRPEVLAANIRLLLCFGRFDLASRSLVLDSVRSGSKIEIPRFSRDSIPALNAGNSSSRLPVFLGTLSSGTSAVHLASTAAPV